MAVDEGGPGDLNSPGGRPEVLVSHRIFGPTLAELETRYTVHKLWLASERDALLHAVAPRVRALVTSGLAGCDAATMDALPALELIATFGSPRASLGLADARQRGIVCACTPDDITGAVADLAFGLMIDVMRGVTRGDRFIRAGLWEKELTRPGNEVRGKRCGIFGLGRIGRLIADRAQAFGMSVSYHGPRPKDVPFVYAATPTALAGSVDVLVACCPLTPATRGLVTTAVLDALGPQGYFVNVARGPVVVEEALTAALREQHIAGAGLDVFWDEPRVPRAYRDFDNVVMTPHIGTGTREVREERGRKVLANLAAHFAGQAVPYPVTHLPDGRGD